MQNFAKIALSFVSGAAISGGITFIFTKRYYELKADKIINDALAQIEKHNDNPVVENKVEEAVIEKPEQTVSELKNIARANNYISTPEYKSIPVIGTPRKEPYKVEDNVYYEANAYDKVSLLYYAGDDTVATDDDTIITDEDYCLGDFKNNFDEDGYQYILNENNGTVYEVVKSLKSCGEMFGPGDPLPDEDD